MDMYKKREMRKNKREENTEVDKSSTSVNIHCPILPNVKNAVNHLFIRDFLK